MAKIVLQIDGASSWSLNTSSDLEAEVVIIDWGEVDAGGHSADALEVMATDVQELCPQAAKDLRAAATEQRRLEEDTAQ